MFEALLMTLEMYIVYATLRFIYQWILYICRLYTLRKTFHKMSKNGIAVTWKRTLPQIVFGNKGKVDIVLTIGEKKYGIALLTHRLGTGRFNIERTRRHYYFEVRCHSLFYNLSNSSEYKADHVEDFGREKQVSRKLMDLSTPAEEYDRLFLLVYPAPKYLTYTETRYKYLYGGDMVADYEILFVDGLAGLTHVSNPNPR